MRTNLCIKQYLLNMSWDIKPCKEVGIVVSGMFINDNAPL
jgi:hypothetical protein